MTPEQILQGYLDTKGITEAFYDSIRLSHNANRPRFYPLYWVFLDAIIWRCIPNKSGINWQGVHDDFLSMLLKNTQSYHLLLYQSCK